MPEDPQQVAEKVESWYESFHRKYVKLGDHWRQHTNRRTIIAAMIAGVLIGAFYVFIVRPPDNFPAGELVTIPEGQNLSSIADTLRQESVIRSPLAFRVIIKI